MTHPVFLQAGRQGLLAAAAAAAQAVIHQERQTRQIAGILEQRKERKEDRRWRQHHRHDSSGRRKHAVQKRSGQPSREPCRLRRLPEQRAQRVKAALQKRRRRICAAHRQPEHQKQQRRNAQPARQPPRQETVHAGLSRGVGASLRRLHHARGDLLRTMYNALLRGLRRSRRFLRSSLRLFKSAAAARSRAFKAIRHIADALQQRVKPFAAARRRPHDRDAQLPFQRMQIDLDLHFFCLVKQIHADDQLRRQLHQLQNQMQIPFETGRVAHRDHALRLPAADELRRHPLLLRAAGERVGTRQIDQHIPLRLVFKRSLRNGDRFPRPVSGVLLPSGQRVEDRALSDIRVSGQRKDARLRVIAPEDTGLPRRTSAGRLRRQSHGASGMTVIFSASFRRMATDAPRIS